MRCYNGCPDSELKAVLDTKAKAHRELARAGLRATYFPMEGAWLVSKNYVPITDFHTDLLVVANQALKEARNAPRENHRP